MMNDIKEWQDRVEQGPTGSFLGKAAFYPEATAWHTTQCLPHLWGYSSRNMEPVLTLKIPVCCTNLSPRRGGLLSKSPRCCSVSGWFASLLLLNIEKPFHAQRFSNHNAKVCDTAKKQ